MKRKKFTMLTVLVLALVAWTFRPYPTIDETKVHPLLRGLDDSAECKWTSFGDGGSMAISIRRQDGREIELCLSNSLDQSVFERGELYIGAWHYTDPASIKIAGYEHSKYVVAKLLAKDIPQHPFSPSQYRVVDHARFRLDFFLPPRIWKPTLVRRFNGVEPYMVLGDEEKDFPIAHCVAAFRSKHPISQSRFTWRFLGDIYVLAAVIFNF